MEVPEKLRDLALSETGFVFDPYTGATFNANGVGLAILQQIKQGASRAEVLAHIAEQFEVRSADVERDLDEFVHVLGQNDLVSSHFVLE